VGSDSSTINFRPFHPLRFNVEKVRKYRLFPFTLMVFEKAVLKLIGRRMRSHNETITYGP